MKANSFFFWRRPCFLIAAFLFGLFLLPLSSSPPAAQDKAACDFRITIVAVIVDSPARPTFLNFDVTIEPVTSLGPASSSIAASKVLVNHTIEIPLHPEISTAGRRHIHKIIWVDIAALGPEALLEVFAQKTGEVPLPGATPPKPLASARISTTPRITWISPAYEAVVKIKKDTTVLPARYLPVEVSWKSSGFTGPYLLSVKEISPGSGLVHRATGISAESYRIPGSVLESGKKYVVQVDNLNHGIPLTVSGPCSKRSSSQHCAAAAGVFTVVKK